MFVKYDEKATDYLKAKDPKMAEVIRRIGHIDRPADEDLFSSVVTSIIGQQISTKAQQTICRRLTERYGAITPELIDGLPEEDLQSLGMTFRKVSYIKDFAHKVCCGEFDPDAVEHMSDEEAIRALSALKGIGVWTAEMILLFCLQRPDIFSYDDLAIQRGLRMIYHHRKVTRQQFEKYRRRFSPYGSVASLYIWAVAGGAIPEMRDYAPKKKAK